MDTIVFIIVVLASLSIQYLILLSAIRKGTAVLRESINDLLYFQLIELKKKGIITDNDVEQRRKQKILSKLEKKFKRGMMVEAEFRKQKANILAD